MKKPTCSKCGCEWDDLLCLDCCKKEKPEGPPLKRLRRYGFKITYAQRQQMRLAAKISNAIPVEVDPETRAVRMDHLYVACNGKTYIGHEWIYPGGSSYSWGESYPPKAA